MKILDKTLKPDVGLLLIRVMVGIVGIFHGAQKLFGAFGGHGIKGTAGFFEQTNIPFPTASVVLAGSAEFFGGLLVAVGLFSRIGALFFAFTMLVASFVVHGKAFSAQNGGMEYPLTLAVVLIGLFFTGPGRYALGRKLPLTRGTVA